ncbi:HK97-gp10 family putative phage morphogenesis protein [Alkalihalophilus marmarensis]|uniref:Phage protein, HK97 gp10 family n=1 Tax=Alkalihalophilus marmarensis DSM 21297 TaxID=1188261 RepID=U6SUL0_9BACI|nr:HK97-gp10 family putative phage morphogenesis protein [Alkalihalophilus marmarensis]ERN54321.1 hypothetical protein A33I_07845 [Alkalihalophilus marmarensis DSM 21297]
MKITGMDELIRNLERLGNQAESVKEKAVMEGAEVIRKRISDNAPRGSTSNSRAADHIVAEYNSSEGKAGIGADAKEAWYLKFPEFGTSRQPAQGFAERAFNDTKSEAKDKMAQALKNGMGL